MTSAETDIEVTDEFVEWFASLNDSDAAAVTARVDLLAERGSSLRRPVVDVIRTSANYPRLKELRCGTTHAIRVLFTFDPRRTAILLLGGSKAGNWETWYEVAVPAADRLYSVYLGELRDEGLLP
jgi:hypothetical protein